MDSPLTPLSPHHTFLSSLLSSLFKNGRLRLPSWVANVQTVRCRFGWSEKITRELFEARDKYETVTEWFDEEGIDVELVVGPDWDIRRAVLKIVYGYENVRVELDGSDLVRVEKDGYRVSRAVVRVPGAEDLFDEIASYFESTR